MPTGSSVDDDPGTANTAIRKITFSASLPWVLLAVNLDVDVLTNFQLLVLRVHIQCSPINRTSSLDSSSVSHQRDAVSMSYFMCYWTGENT